MSKRALFISDLHLEESRPDITDALLAFLSRNKASCSALYILGDLFEAWIGDDDRTALSDTVANALTEFQQAGASIYLLHGNRDFLIGNEYASRCGASLINDSTVIDSPIGSILVLHGDDLCTDDIEYIQFRNLVRQPVWQQEFLSKTLAERRAFAEQARQQSKNATADKDHSIMDVNADAVEKRLIEHDQSLMIHGHTHRPQIHELQLSQPVAGSHEARRVVLGDWDKNGWFVEVSSEGLKLEQFPL